MKFIHLQCLREWTDSKKQFQAEMGVCSYYWENLNCELCKHPLNLLVQSVSNPNQAIFLLDIERPIDQPYMVIESDIECPSKAIHVINFGHKDIYSVGRRISNDISISDISVSRQQAQFKIEDDKVFIIDNESKFGTFLKIHGMLLVDKGVPVVPV